MPEATVRKWGNSQGVILPKDLCDQAGIHIGQNLNIHVEGATLRLVPAHDVTIDALLADYEGELPSEYDWGQPVGKEMW